MSELYGASSDVAQIDRIIERMMADPKRGERISQIVADARLYDSLRENPGWQRLYERVSAKKGKWMQSVLDRFMGSEKFWPKPQEIAYYQGFYLGAMFVLAHPEHAEENLERVARLAYAMGFDEEEDDA